MMKILDLIKNTVINVQNYFKNIIFYGGLLVLDVQMLLKKIYLEKY